MNHDLFHGKLVCLKAVDPETMAEAYSRWSQDTEYWRLMSAEPAQPMSIKSTREWLEEELYKDPPGFTMFAIHTLEDDRLIGEVGFEDDDLPYGETFVAIGIGARENWGKGYGTDAMRVILRYAFMELNLQRVSLTVSEYNSRAIQSYLKAGFVEEGRLRGSERRAGRRFNLVYMGILREEWLQSLQEVVRA
jgi:RimJ/RimL family protein N-acetyltransferase